MRVKSCKCQTLFVVKATCRGKWLLNIDNSGMALAVRGNNATEQAFVEEESGSGYKRSAVFLFVHNDSVLE